MKIIFLDVDGVLNHELCEDWNDKNKIPYVLDMDCVVRIFEICHRTKSRIVISSTWRHSQEGMKVLINEFGDLIIGVTPSIRLKLSKTEPRHIEIEAWLLQHAAIIPLQVCVVDDDEDARCENLPFVQTSFEDGGLTEEKAKQVEAALL